ncbi:uncharacterized protein LOC128756720 [Synchiropus splendidus]|uniref:uncharacterized protein LOC128756720 n=1 Tax=Synchiropus splendidus TaxID=270530 RepID=UPI00237E958F|nr:uncharacterized protein LOC128756720 [Synchiropus splendidus]
MRLIGFTNGNVEVEITPQVPPLAPSTTAFFLLDSDDKTSGFKPSNLVEDIIREDSGIGSELPEGSVFSVAPSRSSTPATFLQQAQIVYEQVPTSEVHAGMLVKDAIDSDLKLSEGRDWINMAAELGAVTLHDDKDPQTTERNTNLPGTSIPIIEDMPLLDLTFLPTSSSTYLQRVRSESPLEKMKANVDQTVEENRVVFIPSLIEDDPSAPVPTAFITSSTDFVSKVSYQEGQDESLTWMVVSDSFGGQLPDATRLALLTLPESTSLPEAQEYPGQPVRVEMEGTPQLFTSNMGPALEEVYPQAPLEIDASLCVEEKSSEPLMVGVPDVSPLMEMKKVLNVIMRQFFDGLSERNLREMSNGIDNLMVKEQLVSMCMSVLEMATRAFVSLANCQDTDVTSSPASCGPSVTLMVDLEQRTSSLVKESTDQNFKMFLVNAISDLADENTTIQTPPEIKDGILNTVTEEVNCILSENIQNSLHSRHSGTNFCQMSTCRLCRKIMARVAREIKLLIKGRRTKKVRPRSSSKADLYPLKLMEQTKGDFANLEPPNLTEVSMKDSSVLKKPSLIKRFWGQLKCKE